MRKTNKKLLICKAQGKDVSASGTIVTMKSEWWRKYDADTGLRGTRGSVRTPRGMLDRSGLCAPPQSLWLSRVS